MGRGRLSSAVVTDRANPTAKCFILGDWWFWGPVCFSCAGASSKLFIELARVQDRINMSKEIIIVALAWVLNAGEGFIRIVFRRLVVLPPGS